MSENKMREALERLCASTDKLLADMRERAIMRGDFDKEPDGRKIAILDCGNGVLFGISAALDAAREALAQIDHFCRTDGRCQYAIDCGAEGYGACPNGKCALPARTVSDANVFDTLLSWLDERRDAPDATTLGMVSAKVRELRGASEVPRG